MEGGAESGFHHVEETQYKPRLLHFSGLKKHIVVKEVGLFYLSDYASVIFYDNLARKLQHLE